MTQIVRTIKGKSQIYADMLTLDEAKEQTRLLNSDPENKGKGIGFKVFQGSNCILPFSDCPYREAGKCDDLGTSPYNSDAGCFKVLGKKKMILRSITNE